MKLIKKITALASCIIMTVLMVGTIPANAYEDAKTNDTYNTMLADEGFRECANVLLNESSTLGIVGNMFDAVVGSPFTIANIDAKKNISNGNMVFYPVIYDSDVIAIISGTKIGKNYRFSVSKGFSKELNNILISAKEVALVNDDSDNIYSVTNDGSTSILSVGDASNVKAYSFTFDEVNDFDNVVSKSYFTTKSNLLANWFNRASTETLRKRILPNYENNTNVCVQQDVTGHCWAYTILSMYRYKVSSSATINDVYTNYQSANPSATNTLGATLTEVYKTIKKMFTSSNGYNPKKEISSLNSLQTIRNIRNGLPVFIRGSKILSDGSTDSTKGHGVVLIGYKRTDETISNSTVKGIYIMNPKTGNVEYNYFGNNDWSFASNGNNYRWDGSVTLKGVLTSN